MISNTNNEVKRPFGCKCETLSERVLGDGCDECNKALAIEMLTDERDELSNEVAILWDENERLRDIADRACNLLNLKGGYHESYELRNEIKKLKEAQ
jgi:hypothetical protein